MKRLINYAADHPWIVLLVLGILSLLATTQLGQLRIMVSAESMLEKGTPAWDYFVETEETFGAEDVAIVVLRDPDIFDHDKLVQARYVLRAIADLPGVVGTSSLFDAKNLKNIDNTIHVKPYLVNLPQTPAEAAQVRADAVRNPLVLGNLISADGQTLAINVYLQRGAADPDFDREITAAIEQQIAPLREHIDTVYQVGVAAMRSDLTAKLRADQQVFLPLSVLVLLLTLAFSLRRATAVVMPLATAGISVLWTLGFMGWLGIPVNIMTSIVPALVIIIG
ncbi:MAG: MMPL family transporter, partial [Sedimenticolaceae bacterium]